MARRRSVAVAAVPRTSASDSQRSPNSPAPDSPARASSEFSLRDEVISGHPNLPPQPSRVGGSKPVLSHPTRPLQAPPPKMESSPMKILVVDEEGPVREPVKERLV